MKEDLRLVHFLQWATSKINLISLLETLQEILKPN